MKVKFVPQDVEFDIQPGQSVMTLAHEKGIPIRSTCNGLPSCAECRVRVVEGDYNTNPPSRKELGLIGTGYYIDQRRLSCQVLCFGDITIDTAEQIEKSAEGPVTKKFLTKVHKATAQDSHSIGGVLLEQDEKLLHELQKAEPVAPQQHPQREGRHGGGRGRDGGRGGGQRDGQRGGQNRPQGGSRPQGGGQNRPHGQQGPPRQAQPGGGQDQPRSEQAGEGGPREGGGGRRRRRGRGGRGRGGGGGGGGGQAPS